MNGLNPPGRGFQEKCHHPPSRKQMSMRTEPRRCALAIAQPPEQTRATALEALMSPQLFTSSQAAAIYSMVAQHGATQQSLLPRPPLLRSKFRHAGEFDLGRASPRWLPVSTPEWIASLNHRSATECRVADEPQLIDQLPAIAHLLPRFDTGQSIPQRQQPLATERWQCWGRLR